MREAIAGRYVGTAVKRVEDPRLLTGNGRYVDDVNVPGMLHATFVRSPHAHAEISGIDVAEARRSPGVHAVFTGADVAAMTYPFPEVMALPGLYTPLFGALAVDRVRVVGDPVALVVADTRARAEDAAGLVHVEYRPLEPVATIEQALDPSVPPIWPVGKSNTVFRESRDYGDVDAAFARADHVVRERFVGHRLSNQPMETRGVVAEVDPVANTLTYHAATQNSHVLKWMLALLTGRRPAWRSLVDIVRAHERMRELGRRAKDLANANKEAMAGGDSSEMTKAMTATIRREPIRLVHLGRSVLGLLAKDPASLPRVVADDIGGGFGVKGSVGREDVAVCAAALELGRSIKWIEDRNEHLLVGGQAREETVEVEAAFRSDGTILGLRCRMVMDQGAYPGFPFGAPMFTKIIRAMIPGPYRIPALRFDSRVVATNKATYVAYRGPWAVETWVRERLLDVAARELGIGRDEIRLRNMVAPGELPAQMVTGPTLDVRMSARATLERALELAEFDQWPARQAAARAEGRAVGLGFATFIEAAPGPPDFQDAVMAGGGALLGAEPARVVLRADGRIAVHTQQVPHGQSHETTFAQVAADELGVTPDDVELVFGDTSATPFGLLGTGGSRAAPMAGGAVMFTARDLRGRILDVAADLLEAAPADLDITDGVVHVQGVPTVSVSLADVARHALERGPAPAPGEAIRVVGAWDGGEGGWAQATHACWVEVDLATGRVRIDRYVAVEDCGELINPAVVDGQVAGGVAQGIGAVLYEKAVYDEQANFQAGTFLDYLLPTAAEIPEIEIHHLETPSDVPANFRGVGEGGMVVAPATLTNAIEDALAHLGVRVTEQHLPPTRILELAGVIGAPR